jgi:hypothetical protein
LSAIAIAGTSTAAAWRFRYAGERRFARSRTSAQYARKRKAAAAERK